MIEYGFDRHLRHDELVTWIDQLAVAHPDLVMLDTYGRSYEGRDLVLVAVTDAATGAHDPKPAHWIDASTEARIEVRHDRAGTDSVVVRLGGEVSA